MEDLQFLEDALSTSGMRGIAGGAQRVDGGSPIIACQTFAVIFSNLWRATTELIS